MLFLVGCFSYTARAMFSEYSFVVIVFYTPDPSSTEEFLLHS